MKPAIRSRNIHLALSSHVQTVVLPFYELVCSQTLRIQKIKKYETHFVTSQLLDGQEKPSPGLSTEHGQALKFRLGFDKTCIVVGRRLI